MNQVMRRWVGISLMAASVLTVGGTFTLQAGVYFSPSVQLQLTGTPATIRVEPKVLMADGGGDKPITCPKGKCWSGEATL
jgi:hypothetical protein